MYLVNGMFGIEMKMISDCLSAQDVHFDALFMELFNLEALGVKIWEYDDLGDIIGEIVYESLVY